MRKIICAALTVIYMLIFSSTALASVSTSVNINPDVIEIKSTVNGGDITVSGNVPDGADVYIKITSPYNSALQLDKKGELGLFWTNMESTIVKNVPTLYQITSSKPLQDLNPVLLHEMGVNPDFSAAFSKAVVIKHAGDNVSTLTGVEAEKYFRVMSDIYAKNKLYEVKDGAVKVSGGQYSASIYLPPSIPPGKCNVTVYAVKDWRIISIVCSSFRVGGIGLGRWLRQDTLYAGSKYVFALGLGAAVAFILNYLERLISGKKTGFRTGSDH